MFLSFQFAVLFTRYLIVPAPSAHPVYFETVKTVCLILLFAVEASILVAILDFSKDHIAFESTHLDEQFEHLTLNLNRPIETLKMPMLHLT